jgi:RNA polymerase sigma-70 factor (ECF subfamily)
MDRLLRDTQALTYRFSVHVCGNVADAEDASQEALLQTYRHAQRIREPRAFRTWLYRTVKNACLMSRRPHAGQPRRLLSLESARAIDVPAIEPSPEDLTGAAAIERRFFSALRTLPKPYRLVVFLREVEGLSTQEAADVAGVSPDTVKQRLHRARAMLRDAMPAPSQPPHGQTRHTARRKK